MSAALPSPLVPADVNLQGLDSFLIDVNRLLASELVAVGTPEQCWAAMMLWCRAWQQRPACSLPDDDKILASFSGAGKRWGALKTMALRGFVKCSDGRLYHPVLAEQAIRLWRKRVAYDAQKKSDRGRKAKPRLIRNSG